ncbi:MAG: UDP-N-acetylglucosamine:LPS N-acetylglucosamine transferase [Chlorobi bacterium]|nr:UDP-N-acetylglucosamine:LPS N-acetylglucosamine transferase [Chlorobiota bacterium]
MFKKVLVLSASAGAGHVRAAEAVEHAFREMGAAEEVIHIDALQYTNRMFRDLYAKAYLDIMKTAPDVLGWLYDQLDKPWKNERRRLAFDKLNTRRLIKMLRKYQPEVVVCTHFLPAEIISWLRAKERLTCRQVIVVTDFDVHAMWLCHNYEHYFVALDETREHLKELGIPAAKLTVSGIPIDPCFSQPKDRRMMRLKHGMDPELPAILVSAGGYGVGPINYMLQSLSKMEHPAQIMVMCGKNEKLLEKITEMKKEIEATSRIIVNPVGYTREMDEYMAASDIVVGKPGGLTTSEALAMGLVFVVVNPIPGQEERNSDHLLEEGAALRCNNLPVLSYKIDRLLGDPAHFEQMRQNALRLARPRAAFTIVEELLAMKEAGGERWGMCD